MTGELLTRHEVAEMLGVKPDWVSLMVARSRIPCVREGRWWRIDAYRFRRSEIEEWMDRTD